MRRVIGFLVLAVVLIGIAFGLGALPGQITATVGSLTIEAPLPLVVLVSIALFLLLYCLIRLGALLFAAPGRLGRGRYERQLRQGDRAVTRAFAALAAADPKAARREAQRAKRLLPNAPMALLVSAEAARLAGKPGGGRTRLPSARRAIRCGLPRFARVVAPGSGCPGLDARGRSGASGGARPSRCRLVARRAGAARFTHRQLGRGTGALGAGGATGGDGDGGGRGNGRSDPGAPPGEGGFRGRSGFGSGGFGLCQPAAGRRGLSQGGVGHRESLGRGAASRSRRFLSGP